MKVVRPRRYGGLRSSRYRARVSLSRLGDLSETELLDRVLPVYAAALGGAAQILVGPGDDAAVLRAAAAGVVVTTDTMVRDLDWRDDWSSGREVGRKAVVQNVADVLAMGGRPTGLLVALMADPQTTVAWVMDLAQGHLVALDFLPGAPGWHANNLGTGQGCSVLGGDLSGAPPGTVAVAVTALGDAPQVPVLRSGAQPGDVVAVAGSLGWSGAGLALLRAGEPERSPQLAAYHRAPTLLPVELWAGRAAAHALIDISDGLVRDLRRIAKASAVSIDLVLDALQREVQESPIAEAFPLDEGVEHVLGGGEEHSLVGCFAPSDLPTGWRAIGRVGPSGGEGGVTLDGAALAIRGWDHFGG